METKHPSIELSISQKTLSCEEVAENLLKTKIMASITPNKSIVCNDKNNCQLEKGCRILFAKASTKTEIKNTWQNLKQKHTLGCAHLKIPGTFSGCIYDYLPDTKCPG
tara:strand:+ start:1554 stop:1877 length:324 start_codon:yes stop_codon:yes gene_type:complete